MTAARLTRSAMELKSGECGGKMMNHDGLSLACFGITSLVFFRALT